MKRNINKLIVAGSLTVIVVIACDKKLNVTDKNNPLQETYFKTSAELQNGVNAIYSTLRSANLVGREWFFLHDMRGGEVWTGGPQLEPPRAELLKQPSPAPTNSVMTSVWTGCYQMINRANMVIAKAPDVKDNLSLRDRLVGEAKFLRAWAYFELVSQWGQVPIYTEPIPLFSTDAFKGKSTVDEVYALIISDLTDAVQKLPPSYNDKELGRATKGAANALLGRVQMQKGDYGAAKTVLLAVYNSNLYSLTPRFSDNFDGDVNKGGSILTTGHEFNSESIFEVPFVDQGVEDFNWGYIGEGPNAQATTVRNQEYGNVWGNVIPSDRILNEFEAGDPRYKFTFWEEGDNFLTMGGTQAGKTLTDKDLKPDSSNRNGVRMKRIYKKYSILDWGNFSFHPGGINQRLIRYADVLLMLAECEAEVGTPAQAAFYINKVRTERQDVKMQPITLSSKNEALRAVMHERAVELAGEEVNNIDILRWRKQKYFPSIMPDPKPGQIDMLPIPFSETSANPKITP